MKKQELTYAEKFAELQPFHLSIFTLIKKDLLDEHLRADKGFFKRNFTASKISKVTVNELIAVYPKIIAAGFNPVAEFIANRWLLRQMDIYNFFEERLKAHTENFDEIQELEPALAKSLLADSVSQFGAENTYIFSVLNAVAFSPSTLKELKANASVTHTHA